MKIKIEGKPQNLSKKLCRAAAHYFAKQLFSKKVNKKVQVTIRFDRLRQKENCWGVAEFIGPSWCPRKFQITIDQNLSYANSLKTLAHELVHVKQWVEGRMFDFSDGRVIFHKKTYSKTWIRTSRYFDMPWEVEAMSNENDLLQKFRQQKELS